MKSILFTVIVIFTALQLSAQQKITQGRNSRIYIIRHAEKQKGDDPLLTDEGNARAGDLMRAMKGKKIRRIYVSQYKRTQLTADSLRLQLHIDTVQINADTSCTALFNAITKNKDWNHPILIITHSNIMQKIIYKLGITGFPQQNIPEKEFDNLYMVRLKKNKPVLQHNKYGKRSASSAAMMQ
jgi:2,3-bisphosphoglycerate-dependent phosphoglycerate mutase